MTRQITHTARSWNGDERGGVTIMFGLTALVLFFCAGLAMDVGLSIDARAKIASAADAAALAAAKGLREQNLSISETEQLARNYFEANTQDMSGKFAVINDLVVRVDPLKNSVEIDVDAEVKTIFGPMAGISKIKLPVNSVAVIEGKDIEIAVQLDVTGSMSGSKLRDLKAAVSDLIDITIPDTATGQLVRVGLAPYSAGVNAGSYASRVAGNRTAPRNCVYERRTASLQYTDAAPVGQAALKIKTDLQGAVQDCPSAVVTPLLGDKSTDKRKLLQTVESYQAGGSTAGQLGTAWAWYLLAPEWQSIWNLAKPAASYDDADTIKVAILMTDGEYNTVGGVMSNSNVTTASGMARDTCAAMRDKNIVVYTIGFQIREPGADAVLSACASDSGKYYRPETGKDLKEVFRDIARDITTLRLSH